MSLLLPVSFQGPPLASPIQRMERGCPGVSARPEKGREAGRGWGGCPPLRFKSGGDPWHPLFSAGKGVWPPLCFRIRLDTIEKDPLNEKVPGVLPGARPPPWRTGTGVWAILSWGGCTRVSCSNSEQEHSKSYWADLRLGWGPVWISHRVFLSGGLSPLAVGCHQFLSKNCSLCCEGHLWTFDDILHLPEGQYMPRWSEEVQPVA